MSVEKIVLNDALPDANDGEIIQGAPYSIHVRRDEIAFIKEIAERRGKPTKTIAGIPAQTELSSCMTDYFSWFVRLSWHLGEVGEEVSHS